MLSVSVRIPGGGLYCSSVPGPVLGMPVFRHFESVERRIALKKTKGEGNKGIFRVITSLSDKLNSGELSGTYTAKWGSKPSSKDIQELVFTGRVALVYVRERVHVAIVSVKLLPVKFNSDHTCSSSRDSPFPLHGPIVGNEILSV